MIYKTSELNVDTTVKLLLDSELGFLLIQSDSPNSDMYDLLSKKYAFVDRQGMFGNNTCLTFLITNRIKKPMKAGAHIQGQLLFAKFLNVGLLWVIINATAKTHTIVSLSLNISTIWNGLVLTICYLWSFSQSPNHLTMVKRSSEL